MRACDGRRTDPSVGLDSVGSRTQLVRPRPFVRSLRATDGYVRTHVLTDGRTTTTETDDPTDANRRNRRRNERNRPSDGRATERTNGTVETTEATKTECLRTYVGCVRPTARANRYELNERNERTEDPPADVHGTQLRSFSFHKVSC